ncbi:ABC transporter permease [Flavobacterium branchiophilum]|nr:ABC transporter permease [Flavobacterium branchiophilum] [Flavobacterium branchiophilum NBRC 15030 = ATCC 35035]TQM41782.1 putative ABC transport system permease protein [Flavobacterium branchiophilum]GEM56675.1 ABC transporter permease [Flavobacterium branchiophilum NBRC 15030 = ATCC 35035]
MMLKLFKENIKIALGSIRTQVLRTVLTVFIIAIGIMALVGILTVVAALENKISTNFASMGSNTFNFTQYDFAQRNRGSNETETINPIISYSDVVEFKRKYNYPLTQTAIYFTATTNAEVKFESQKTDPEIAVLGVDENYMQNSGLIVDKGRNFAPFDIQNNTYSVVIGSDFLKGIFKDVPNPLDKIIAIRGAKFKVIGILKEKGSTFGRSQDLRVFIPIQLARSLFTKPNINYSVSSMVQKHEILDQAVDNATITMRKVRGLNPTQDNNFAISRSDDLLHKIADMTGYLNVAAIVIGLITIFGSSIALMNIMFVSVTERTREIGVRKALGAKRSTIATQFFMETIIIGQLGGILGTILGILIGFAFAKALDFTFVTPWKAIFGAFGISFLVAIISGLIPALKAAKLDPIESLRYE